MVVNVYDLVNTERLAKLGLGIHHSGIQILDSEWSFGGGGPEDDVTGVFAIFPKTATPDFRESIVLGTCDVSLDQLQDCLRELQAEWRANTYDLLTRNCNHFSETLAKRLGFTNFPGWVNRAARISNTLIPKSLLQCVMQQILVPSGQDAPESPPQIEQPTEERMPIPSNLEELTARQLRTIMYVYNINWEGCLEKEDLVLAIQRWQQQHPQ